MMIKIRSNLNAQHIERRAVADFTAGEQLITGHAARFDQLSGVLYDWWYGFREQIAPGAFAATLADDDHRMLWNHNPDYPLARTSAGNLTLREDDLGLWFETTPVATTIAGDVLRLIASRVVSGMSFGFTVLDEEWDEDQAGQIIRTLLKIKLYEISPVTWPAYPTTDVALASDGRAGRPLTDVLGDRPILPPRLRHTRQQRLALRRRYLDLMQRQ